MFYSNLTNQLIDWLSNNIEQLRVYELRHDKTNKVTVRPAKTQISLGTRQACSESSLCAQWVVTDPNFLHADSEDSDQTGCPGWSESSLAHRSFCWFCHEAAHIVLLLCQTFVLQTETDYRYTCWLNTCCFAIHTEICMCYLSPCLHHKSGGGAFIWKAITALRSACANW